MRRCWSLSGNERILSRIRMFKPSFHRAFLHLSSQATRFVISPYPVILPFIVILPYLVISTAGRYLIGQLAALGDPSSLRSFGMTKGRSFLLSYSPPQCVISTAGRYLFGQLAALGDPSSLRSFGMTRGRYFLLSFSPPQCVISTAGRYLFERLAALGDPSSRCSFGMTMEVRLLSGLMTK